MGIVSPFVKKSRLKFTFLILQIFSEACEPPGGFEKILHAFEDFKQFKQERYRFEGLVHTVIFRGRLNNPAYQVKQVTYWNICQTSLLNLFVVCIIILKFEFRRILFWRYFFLLKLIFICWVLCSTLRLKHLIFFHLIFFQYSFYFFSYLYVHWLIMAQQISTKNPAF